MFQPNNLEYLAAERQAELQREAQRMRLVAELRPPRRSWRERVGRGLQVAGTNMANWGERMADTPRYCSQDQSMVYVRNR